MTIYVSLTATNSLYIWCLDFTRVRISSPDSWEDSNRVKEWTAFAIIQRRGGVGRLMQANPEAAIPCLFTGSSLRVGVVK